jgi:hypothetical protein
MENKEQPNQNPESVDKPKQEENAETAEMAVENHTEKESPNADSQENEKEGDAANKPIEILAVDDETYDFDAEKHPDLEDVDEDDEEDEDDETSEDSEIVEISDEEYEAQFKEASLADMINAFEALFQDDELRKIRSRIFVLRRLIDAKLEEEKALELEKFIAAGGNETEFVPQENSAQIQYNKVLGIYRSRRAKYRAEQERLQAENLVKKKELLEELRLLVNSDETLKSTYDQFKEIQERWKEVGMIPKSELGELWKNYHFLVEKFFDKVKISNELRDLDLKKNVESKLRLCEKAEELLLEKSVTKSFKLLQKYHEEWKVIGPVPSNMKDELWERFKAITDKINHLRRDYYKQLQDKLGENYKAKLALCERAEAIHYSNSSSIKDWNKYTETFNALFKEWKTIGPTPRKVNEEVWQRFKTYLNGFFNAKKKYFAGIKDEQANNYQQKLAICMEAESMQESTSWKQTTEVLIKLQKDWKAIGPVPRKYSDAIWKRFRKACDVFFDAKSAHYKGMVQKEDENAKLKTALIEEIKAAKFSEDKADNLKLIKDFQKRWHEIGNVPRKLMDKLNRSYREAIDLQLDKFDISKVDFRNSGFKEKIHSMKEKDDNYHLNRERYAIQKSLDKLKEDVLLWENNIGFFANSKNADVLKMEFEKKIERAKAEVASLKDKLKIIDRG